MVAYTPTFSLDFSKLNQFKRCFLFLEFRCINLFPTLPPCTTWPGRLHDSHQVYTNNQAPFLLALVKPQVIPENLRCVARTTRVIHRECTF
jgi:hypothetical protein